MEKPPELTPENYINRELSWIDFNCRVLAQAHDESIPLLERIKFLAIVSSNTDEFFMVRVAFVHQKLKLGLPTTRPDGIPYAVLMDEIRTRIVPGISSLEHIFIAFGIDPSAGFQSFTTLSKLPVRIVSMSGLKATVST